ncbi:phosphate regulon sensor histidine kinase PhoR [Inhella sp.]|uniref:phosphate regulon sensor histidine kinase PhoR n=1 Tax=Inhella sp. TaxID=1921806 RepID=UPI0035B2D31B
MRGLQAGLALLILALAVLLPLHLPGVADSAWLSTSLAAAITALGWGLLGTWRVRALLAWLRQPRERAAPVLGGAFAELIYRIERLLDGARRDAERERLRLQNFLSAIEASPNGVLLLDANEQIVWLNSQAADHFGLHPERDLMQRITNLVRHPDFVRYLQSNQYQQMLTVPLHDGRSLALTLRHYGEGARLLLSQDVSERERTEAMRRDFVANVSHEIRTPLAALTGFVETMATLPLQEGERARVLELMRQQSQRMQSLVDDLLTLARLEGSPRPPADAWWSLDDLLDLVQAEAQGLSAGRHEFVWPQARTGLALAGVDSEVHSALTNLLSNAVRYTPPQGCISLSLERLEDGGLQLSVQDNGPGIAAEHLPRLTERFYRVDGSRSRATGGTGLGLSIVKHICQRHGGQLRIESEVGRGSRFSLCWPANRVRSA